MHGIVDSFEGEVLKMIIHSRQKKQPREEIPSSLRIICIIIIIDLQFGFGVNRGLMLKLLILLRTPIVPVPKRWMKNEESFGDENAPEKWLLHEGAEWLATAK
jgi:hypothetical protein